ncbi:phage tail protein [Shewanella sp. 10N.286.54.B9]|uniref:phage tail protein n=1 Tax=Shewanella sp. 10N.286.54.B9 TaxID=3229719 RepID=UPI00354BE471
MSDKTPELPMLKAPWWMDGKTLATTNEPQEPAMLTTGLQAFWQRVRGWFSRVLVQKDPLTCSVEVLNLLAWERAITRFNDEPLWLYRKRVAYAFVNAKDAGSTQGFIAIMHRLGLEVTSIRERQAGQDWDRVSIEIDDTEIAPNQALLAELIRSYGRTCRRYDHLSVRLVVNNVALTEANHDFQTLTISTTREGDTNGTIN